MENEKHIIIVDDDYLKEHLDIFSHAKCKVTKTVVQDDMFKDDQVYKDLLKVKQKAEKNLRDYEFNIRHNHK
jgi:hypothetical protein